MMRWAGHVTSVSVIRNAYHVLAAKPERKWHLGGIDVRGSIILTL
jgi:hypothetical protein